MAREGAEAQRGCGIASAGPGHLSQPPARPRGPALWPAGLTGKQICCCSRWGVIHQLCVSICPPSPFQPRQIRCLKILLKSGNSSPRLTRGVDRRDACPTHDSGCGRSPQGVLLVQNVLPVIGVLLSALSYPRGPFTNFQRARTQDHKSDLSVVNVLARGGGPGRPRKVLPRQGGGQDLGWLGLPTEP